MSNLPLFTVGVSCRPQKALFNPVQSLNWSSSALIESSISPESDNYGMWQLKPTTHTRFGNANSPDTK